MLCRQPGGTVITIDYQTKMRALHEGVYVPETTLLAVLHQAKWYAFWHSLISKKSYRKLLDDKFFDLVKES